MAKGSRLSITTAADIRQFVNRMSPYNFEAARKGLMWFDPITDIGQWVFEGAPSNGSTGTLAGVAGLGSKYLNATTGASYINTGTKASPTWTAVADTYY